MDGHLRTPPIPSCVPGDRRRDRAGPGAAHAPDPRVCLGNDCARSPGRDGPALEEAPPTQDTPPAKSRPCQITGQAHSCYTGPAPLRPRPHSSHRPRSLSPWARPLPSRSRPAPRTLLAGNQPKGGAEARAGFGSTRLQRLSVGVWVAGADAIRVGVGDGQPKARSAVRRAGGGEVMAEPTARHLSLPSGLLELCALLGASQDSLRGLEQVRGGRGN